MAQQAPGKQVVGEMVTTKNGTFEIRSEARGPHWIAWLARPSDGKPQYSAVLIGRTREEAEANARQWAAQR